MEAASDGVTEEAEGTGNGSAIVSHRVRGRKPPARPDHSRA
jgi:hypothetical protein